MGKRKTKDLKTAPSIVSKEQAGNRNQLMSLYRKCPLPTDEVPTDEVLRNLGLFLNPADLKKFLFINDIYSKAMAVHGVVMEFGVRWGQNLSLFQSLRSIYEPFNYSRRLIGFDTFEGFPSIHHKDGKEAYTLKGGYNVTDQYEDYLFQLLRNLEQESPLGHVQKFELRKGDASVELEKYLLEHPETIISLAYFDFDLYEPTKNCLELIRSHITRGSVIAFDELCQPKFPGESLALQEVLGFDRYSIRRSPYSHYQSYIIVD
jgi:hypothetical protein